MVPLREQQLQDHSPVFREAFGLGRDLHPFRHFRHAGRQQTVRPLDLHQAQPARTHIGKAVKMTERRNVNVVFASRPQESSGRPAH